jgi:hypothetical protein
MSKRNFFNNVYEVKKDLHDVSARIGMYTKNKVHNCSLQSRRGRIQEDKRMAYIYTHGLFIT